MGALLLGLLKTFGGGIVKLFVGGSLDSILDTIDRKLDGDVEKEKVKADVTKTWISKQAELLVGRTWWFQLFFVIPTGLYWAALLYVSAAPPWMPVWTVNRLPGWAETIYLGIVSALFMVDGGKALAARFKK